MHVLVAFLRLVFELFSSGLWAARIELARQPEMRIRLKARAGLRPLCVPAVAWMNVRPVAKRSGIPPDDDRFAPVAERGGGRRRLIPHRPGTASPFLRLAGRGPF
jgi:hypothetical protein